MLKKTNLLIVSGLVLTSSLSFGAQNMQKGDAQINSMVKEWSQGLSDFKPVMDSKGIKRFAYGYTMPLVVCSPFHLCSIYLEAGEQVNDVVIGDKRFQVKLGDFGKDSVPVLWVKPVDYQLQTNMVVTTDRRVYQFLVASPDEKKSTEVTPSIGFYYPEDMIEEWKSGGGNFKGSKTNTTPTYNANNNKEINPSSQNQVSKSPFVFDARNMNEDYSVRVESGDAEDGQVPDQIFDNGRQTFIRFNQEPQSLPVFSVLSKNGNGEVLVNWRVVDGYYVIDRVSDKMQLRIGGLENGLKIIIEKEKQSSSGGLFGWLN
jgi:P-type conjugative transfer protein TrbG